MVAWLLSQGVTHVTMEATGIYWKPIFHALCESERPLDVLLVNARHVKNVPGRKSDALDAVWLAELTECGLLRGSFIPPPQIAAIRELTRYRKKLIEQRQRAAAPGQSPRGQRDQNRLSGLNADHRRGEGEERGVDKGGPRPRRTGRSGPRGDAQEDPRAEDGVRGPLR